MVGRSHRLGTSSYSKIYSHGTKIIALKDERPYVKKNNSYTVEKLIESSCLGKDGKNLALILKEVEGIYSIRTFKLAQETKALQ